MSPIVTVNTEVTVLLSHSKCYADLHLAVTAHSLQMSCTTCYLRPTALATRRQMIRDKSVEERL